MRSERSRLSPSDHDWATQRRLDDVFGKLGERFGDRTGRAEVRLGTGVSFDEVGGLESVKVTVRGFARALTNPELYHQWGIAPPRGVLRYGPPGVGKSMLARALASASEAIFYHEVAEGKPTAPVSTEDLAQAIDRFKRVRGVVETIRYGQYL